MMKLCCFDLFACALQTFEEAVAMNNSVPQGLSSSIFTGDVKSAFRWMGCVRSTWADHLSVVATVTTACAKRTGVAQAT